MWVCSGSQNESTPRSSAARHSSTASIVWSVAKIVIPNFTRDPDDLSSPVSDAPSDPARLAPMTGICDGTGRDRDRRRPGHRPGPRARVRPAGRQRSSSTTSACELDGSDARRRQRPGRRRWWPRSRPSGGAAVANGDDIADWAGAERLVQTAIDTFGSIDTVVNNAGFVRDRMFANATEDEWDAVVRVHLKGHFCVARHAAAWWRSRGQGRSRHAGPHREHVVRRRAARLGRPGRVLGGQGRDRGPHAGAVGRARPLRGHGQRHRPRRPHADDRDGLRRRHGGARRRLRRQGPGERRPAGRLAGLRPGRSRHRPGVRDRRRPAHPHGRLPPRPDDRQGRPVGRRPSSAPSSTTSPAGPTRPNRSTAPPDRSRRNAARR